MSERLDDLRRQRALAQAQVEWFDREIAREAGAKPAPANPAGNAAASPPAPPPAPAEDADALIEQYRGGAGSLHGEVKRGCLIYFIGAFVLLFLGLAAFELYRRLGH